MTLTELDSTEAVQGFIQNNPKALVTYSATWCGPCKASKPDLERMADEFSKDISRDVNFGIAYEHNLGDGIQNYNVKAFPTYILFVNQLELGRVEGANLQGVRELIDKAGKALPSSGGHSLGGEGTASLSAEEARAQRIARLGGPTPPPNQTETVIQDQNMSTEPEAEEAAHANDVEMKDAEKTTDPTENLDPQAIQTLTESMGFSLLRAQKGLLYGNGATVEGAVEWLLQHQDDDDIDNPIPEGPIGKAQSYKCNECGKILSNMANLELHANKTGHSDFEESTVLAPTLTPEEKTRKIAEIKDLLKAKRAEREEKEKDEEVDREKQRRFMGKEVAKTKEQMDADERKRDAWKRKKEKDNFKKERERLRAELAKDKAERIANKGKLGSRLGAEGYKPDGVQYDLKEHGEGAEVEHKKPRVQASTAKIDEYIKKISSYRAGGDGGKCFKVLLAYVGNTVDNPDEDKFKSINMENNAFKTKIKPFLGAKQLLLAVGFKPNVGGDALVLSDDADTQLLAGTKAKLKAAFDAY